MLLTAGLLSEIVYLFLINSRIGVKILDLHNDLDFLKIFLSLIILFLIYFGFYLNFDFKKIKFKNIFLISIIFNLTFLLVPFINSDDLYSYVFQGRVLTIFHSNPYLVPYDNFAFDPLYQSIKTIWSAQTPLYSPLFILLSGVINLIGQNNLGVLLYLIKNFGSSINEWEKCSQC